MGVFVSGADGILKKVAGNARNLTFDNIYPVGSIYTSTNPKSPAELFGIGTWEQIKDRFLLGAGSTYTEIYKDNGDGTYSGIGGEATHTLTINEMPNHTHKYRDDGRNTIAPTASGYVTSGDRVNINASGGGYVLSVGINTAYTGGGQPHNNMPPYATVYMWQRVED